jgi:hypothetical protein
MAKRYFGFCFRCKAYKEVTFRTVNTDMEDDEDEPAKKRGKRFVICLDCLRMNA